MQGAETVRSPEETHASVLRSQAIATPVGQSLATHEAPASDPVEAALADALTRAASAGQWDAVATLARELQARREARAAVVDLDVERHRRGR